MVVLCVVWGLQQSAVKASAPDVAPIFQMALRSIAAALLVRLAVQTRRESLDWSGWRPGLLVGLLFALEFLFFGEGLARTTASHATMFLYTAPAFAALGLHWKLPSERLGTTQWMGIVLAFAGIVVTFSGRSGPTTSAASSTLLGDGLALLGGVAWGATTVVVRCSALAQAPATQTLLYQLVGASALLTPIALVTGQAGFRPTPLALASLAFQALVVSFASYLTWFWLLRTYLASRLGVLSFLTPLFGIGFAAWLLKEPLEKGFLAGAALVFAGILMVGGEEWRRAWGLRTSRP